MHLSEDPRRQVLQRRIFIRQSQRWQTWWEANWRTLTDDDAYQKIGLPIGKEADRPAPAPVVLGKKARLGDRTIGAVLSPPNLKGNYFYDLDTGFEPQWPNHIDKDKAAGDQKQLMDWVTQNGIDLMCINHRSPDGTETFVLKALGMKVREISARDLRNFDSLMADGKLPEGRAVDELLMHYEAESDQLVPDANGIFLFVTREGNMGIIETTDRVTRVADLTGQMSTTPGVGFHKGVRFNLTTIIP